MDEAVTLAARVLAGLLAGVYVGFVVGVMPALRGVDDRTFVDVMQRINVSIVNPVFVAIFLGAPALAVWAALLDRSAVAWVAATLGVATLVVSFAVNIPLNDELQRVSLDGAVDTVVHAARARFEGRWVAWNGVRAVTGAASLLCLLRVSP